jgi:hypothetical protein
MALLEPKGLTLARKSLGILWNPRLRFDVTGAKLVAVFGRLVPAISIIGAACLAGLYDFIPITCCWRESGSASAILAKRNTPKK